VVSCVVFSLHNIDFAFLRDRPEMAPLGFTLATLIIFALSITAPAVVLENVAERQARIDAEVQAARYIQTRLLPQDIAQPDFEMVCHMRPAESVGGDYFDVYTAPDGSWFFLGDVTGHGLGAGLVTLMAQSTVTAILQARPDVSPRELNYLANRVLSANLLRLGEERHMTFVALRSLGGGKFAVSGSHDTLFIHRAGDGAVEPVELGHFPFGLGFLADLGREAFGQDTVTLAPGDILFMGSDGITEAARAGRATSGLYGEAALMDLLREFGSRPLPEIRAQLVARLEAFTEGVYHDDVSFLMVRATHTSAERASQPALVTPVAAHGALAPTA
jgi:serine phosphatase RsbU (regulator of sigma subunit)